MRDGTSAYGWWIRLSDFEIDAAADSMWWVMIIDPEGVGDVCGGGATPAEAAAVAWINNCLGAWWWPQESGMSDEDYAKVPSHVPGGYRFELYETPVRAT